VTRALTERPEGLEAGAVRIVGTSRAVIRREVRRLLDDDDERATMSRVGRQVYGDGLAAKHIADVLIHDLRGRGPRG
jgi:UDP-N-acetylglucosamine 2-epimerase (non-hydrolysing)